MAAAIAKQINLFISDPLFFKITASLDSIEIYYAFYIAQICFPTKTRLSSRLFPGACPGVIDYEEDVDNRPDEDGIIFPRIEKITRDSVFRFATARIIRDAISGITNRKTVVIKSRLELPQERSSMQFFAKL
jgi:hypothetical protein